MDKPLDKESEDGLKELNQILNRYHLKILDRIVILQTLEKLIRNGSKYSFLHLTEVFNKINCFNSPIRALEENIKVQIIEHLEKELQQKLQNLMNIDFVESHLFGSELENIQIKIEAADDLNQLKKENLSEKAAQGNEEKKSNESVSDGFSHMIQEMTTLLHYLKKIDTQSIEKLKPHALKFQISKLEWVFEFFQKLKELVEFSDTERISFSFNEFWKFLKNESINHPFIKAKIDNFMNFYTSKFYF